MLKLFGKKLDTIGQVEAAIEEARAKIQRLSEASESVIEKSTADNIEEAGKQLAGYRASQDVLRKQISVLNERREQLQAVAKQEAEQRACEDKARLDAQFYAMKAKILDQLVGIFGKDIAQEIFKTYRSKAKALREIEYLRDEAMKALPRTPMAALPCLGPQAVQQVDAESHVQADA